VENILPRILFLSDYFADEQLRNESGDIVISFSAVKRPNGSYAERPYPKDLKKLFANFNFTRSAYALSLQPVAITLIPRAILGLNHESRCVSSGK